MITFYESQLDYKTKHKGEDKAKDYIFDVVKALDENYQTGLEFETVQTVTRKLTSMIEASSASGYVYGFIEAATSFNNQAREGRFSKIYPMLEEENKFIYVPNMNEQEATIVHFAIWEALGVNIITPKKEALNLAVIYNYLKGVDNDEQFEKVYKDNNIYINDIYGATDKTALKIAMIALFAKKFGHDFYINQEAWKKYEKIGKPTILAKNIISDIANFSEFKEINDEVVVTEEFIKKPHGSLEEVEVPAEIPAEEAQVNQITSQKAATRRHTIKKIELSNNLRKSGIRTIMEECDADVVAFNGEYIDIYEVKTGTNSIYSGIGQLLVYSERIARKYKTDKINLYLVHRDCDELRDEATLKVFSNLGINVITK